MTYSPHTDPDRERMLEAIGAATVDDLFADIPTSVRASDWDLPAPLTEQEVRTELARLAGRNRMSEVSFLGAGVYRVPARGEPGHAPEHLRIPVAHLRADRHGGRHGLTLRRGDGYRRGRAHGLPPHP